MRIVRGCDLQKSKTEIASESYKVCKRASFPVDEEDVYNHLYENDELVQRFLVNEHDDIVGFGVAQEYIISNDEANLTLAYLQGMVINKEYQGNGFSLILLKDLYDHFNSDLYGLRTQNPKMAKAMLNLFKKTLLKIPSIPHNKEEQETYIKILELLEFVPPYEEINKDGIIKNCYPNQLCEDYKELQLLNPKINISEHDALAVVVQPQKNNPKQLIKDRNIIKR